MKLITAIKCMEMSYLGHIFSEQRYQLPRVILNGKIESQRGVGSKQFSWLKYFREWSGIHNVGQLCHLAIDREKEEEIIISLLLYICIH